MSDYGKMKSEVESTLDALLSPTQNMTSQDNAEQIFEIGAGYIKTRIEHPTTAQGDDEEEDEDELYRDSTPGVPRFFSTLWGAVIERVQNAPVESRAQGEYITRLIDLSRKLKEKSQPEAQEWLIGGEKTGWDQLPLLGSTIRDVYNEPIDTTGLDSSTLFSQEAQAVVAGASQPKVESSGHAGSESIIIRLAKSRNQWLSLQEFISCLWRDVGCNDYALYAIWALRPALEDWPESPPKPDAKSETFEQSAAYLAFQVEAATIWIRNTAPLMYDCTRIWGPNGDPDWPKRAGAPGRGGKRWSGVDGYDREHKRWQLWKDVLGEVVQWHDGVERSQVQGWKVKDASTSALEAMEQAERR
ncbi:unnamed protein product [Rhizoctonia solani]|uniref:Uncharacterized protein n=1 Tax=Rhizoctonia solani TaxID=456999 RepID=A0A8H2XLT2_9AGAM|nr:unnamed protein product [Rhizoctonia solani]